MTFLLEWLKWNLMTAPWVVAGSKHDRHQNECEITHRADSEEVENEKSLTNDFSHDVNVRSPVVVVEELKKSWLDEVLSEPVGQIEKSKEEETFPDPVLLLRMYSHLLMDGHLRPLR